MLLPSALILITFNAGLLYIMGGPTGAARETIIPVSSGFVLLLVIVLLGAVQSRRARVAVLVGAVVVVVASAGLALALSDDRTAALTLTAGAFGMAVLGLAAAIVEMATGREM